jgi:hypothetical protein
VVGVRNALLPILGFAVHQQHAVQHFAIGHHGGGKIDVANRDIAPKTFDKIAQALLENVLVWGRNQSEFHAHIMPQFLQIPNAAHGFGNLL